MVASTKDAAGHMEGYEIFINYLPQEATAPELKAWFGEAGEIVGDVRLMTNPATGKCKQGHRLSHFRDGGGVRAGDGLGRERVRRPAPRYHLRHHKQHYQVAERGRGHT